MKKIYILGALAVAATALFSCNKEQDVVTPEEPKGIPFEIVAGTIDTKTVNDANVTNWVSGDQINLFHAENGGEPYTYVSDGAFEATADGNAVAFTGTLGSALDGEKSYDWYAIYPYVAPGVNSPASFANVVIGSAADGAQTQTGAASKAHLAGVNYPLAGRQLDKTAATKPTIEMKQITSVVEFNVTNKTAAPFKVTKIEFSCPDNADGLVGSYTINFSGSTPSFTAGTTNTTATLNVSGDSNIAVDGSSTYYLAIKPFTAAAGTKVSITVYTDVAGATTFNNFFPVAFEFQANKIHTFNVNYNTTSVGLAELKYNNTTWLGTNNIALPSAGGSTNLNGSFQKESPVWIKTLKNAGSNNPVVFNSAGAYDLRVYKKNTIEIGSYNNKMITKITFSSISDLGKLSADVGTFTSATKTWIGRAAKVVFTSADDAGTMRFNAVNVFYQDAEDSEHVLVVPTTAFSVGYEATTLHIPIYAVNATGLTAASTNPACTSVSASAVNGEVVVSVADNTSSSTRPIVITVSSTNPDVSTDITITQDGAPISIGTLAKDQEATVSGKVAALTTNGFILADDSGAIFVYKSGTGVSIGQTVTVAGTVATYNKGLQFPNTSTVTPGAEGSFAYGAATSYTSTEITTWNGDSNNRLASYVTMTGTVKKESTYINLIVGEGSTPNATLYSPLATLVSGVADGDNITVTGYAINVSSSKCGVVPTAVTNNTSAPKIEYTDITGIAAAGVTGAHLTVVPYRTDGWAAGVTYTGCVSAASINPALTEITYSVSENTVTSAKAGTIVVTFTKGGESDVVYTINVAQLAKEAGGNTYTYTFTNKSWNATLGGDAANWTSGKDGYGFSNNGVTVTSATDYSGANATSPKSFTGVSKVTVTYNTNKSAGAGSIVIKVGTNDDVSHDVSYAGSGDGRSANYTEVYNYATKQNGNVKITVNTTTNSLYICSISIVADSISE